ncbi:MAG: hypothetical protein ACOYVF_08360 [Candidatus Zixiibacteriota bacterium]
MNKMDSIIYHYPPDLFQQLINTIPLLMRSKKDLILFFRGAGVEDKYLADLQQKVNLDKDSINKYEIARTVLKRINEKGESTL